MKKVGIITFHSSHNCGSILQTYALQQVLIKQSLKPEVIDFSNDGSKQKYSLYLPNKSLKNIAKNILYFIHFRIKNKNYWSYENYIENNIKISKEKYHSLEEMDKVEEKYDLFISGSDQIWNITCLDADDAYFLPFVKTKKKIAYAPSLGAKSISNNTNEIEKYKRYINSYDFLSVREKNGKKWIEELTNKEVKIIADPTLLLDATDYDKIAIPSRVSGEYIFYYSYGYSDDENEVVNNIAKYFNLPVYIFNGKRYVTLKYRYKTFKIPYTENPGVFLDLMKNAKYVFTSSFHGTVFSSLYHKNFWVFKNSGMKSGDDRATCLLEQLGLLDRFIDLDNDIDYTFLNNQPDYSKFNENIQKLREEAHNYLKTALGGDSYE